MTTHRVSLGLNVCLALVLFALSARWLWRRASPQPDYWGESHRAATKDIHAELELPRGSIVFIGDSLIEYGPWAELLKRPDVFNRGIAGDTAAGLRERLDSVARSQPKLVVVLVGINDLAAGRPAEDVVADIAQLVAALRRGAPSARIILQSVLPVRATRHDHGVAPSAITATNHGLEAVAEKLGVQYLDVGRALADDAGDLSAELTVDGIHLNGAGYRRWADVLTPVLDAP